MATKKTSTDVLPPEQGNPQAEIVAQGHTLVRLENTTQMTVAIQRPRDEAAILEAALRELDTYRSCAENALYSKPVGRDPQTNNMKYAEGPSIRAAESLANRWSNSAYACGIESEDDDAANLTAVFLDYETNTRHVISRRVSKFYKTRQGQIVQYAPDRYDTVLAAEQSKLLREVILRSLPSGLKSDYVNKAREVLEQRDPKERIETMEKVFASLDVSVEMLERARGKKLKEFLNHDINELQGVYNALKDGEISIAEAFPEATEPATDKPKAAETTEAPPMQVKSKAEPQEKPQEQADKPKEEPETPPEAPSEPQGEPESEEGAPAPQMSGKKVSPSTLTRIRQLYAKKFGMDDEFEVNAHVTEYLAKRGYIAYPDNAEGVLEKLSGIPAEGADELIKMLEAQPDAKQ